MREILFRGKTLLGKWIEGDLLQYLGCGKVHIAQNYKGAGGQEVIPETVGQYTGLTDKNGERIFEGDIIKQKYSLSGGERAIISVIEYGISYSNIPFYVCGVCQSFRDGSGESVLLAGDTKGAVYCEVIGNIHDNPELLRTPQNDEVRE